MCLGQADYRSHMEGRAPSRPYSCVVQDCRETTSPPIPYRGPPLAKEKVEAFVRAGHSDLAKVKEMLAAQPSIVNAGGASNGTRRLRAIGLTKVSPGARCGWLVHASVLTIQASGEPGDWVTQFGLATTASSLRGYGVGTWKTSSCISLAMLVLFLIIAPRVCC